MSDEGPTVDVLERIAVAGKITRLRRSVANEVNDEFFSRHPDWLDRYGRSGVQRGFEDACYHLDYLAAAVEAGSVELFEHYARWSTRVLESRGILRNFLIENLEQIRDSLGPHLSPEENRGIARYILAGATAAVQVAAAELAAHAEGPRRLFVNAILRGLRAAALNIATEQLSRGATVSEVYVEICAKALWDVGELWEHNQITVADEHRATAITQYVIAQLYSRIPLPETQRGNVIVTGVEGELHQLGANIFADTLEADGWSVCFLGTNLPHKSILQKIEEHQAAAICISVTMPFNIVPAWELVRDIRARFGKAIKIVLGGQAFAEAGRFCKEAGADAWALNAHEGATILAELADTSARS